MNAPQAQQAQRTPGPLATEFSTGSTTLSDGSKVYHVDIWDRGARVLVHCIDERSAEKIEAALNDGSSGINVYHGGTHAAMVAALREIVGGSMPDDSGRLKQMAAVARAALAAADKP